MQGIPPPAPGLLRCTTPVASGQGGIPEVRLTRSQVGADGMRVIPRETAHHRRGDRIKLLLWDTDGFLILYKRLEKGTFRFPTPSEAEATSVTVKATDLIMLLDGVDLQSVERRPRYVREST